MSTIDATTTGRAASRPVAGRRSRRKWLELGLFVLPALALYAVFVLYPIAKAAQYSLYAWNGIEDLTDFVGLDNYRRAFEDEAFRGAIVHNAIIVVLSLVVQFPLALGVALLLNQPLRGRSIFRLIFFAPFVLAEAIAAVLWLLMLQPDGLVDRSFQAVGLGGLVQLWLADTEIVLFTLFVVITWKYIGFGIILFLAGLQGVPRELDEAAAIDGATAFQRLRYVTLPLLGPTIRIWAFLAIIGSIQLFDVIWIMTDGGPADASNTMATYMIDWSFKRFQFGYASAVAVIMLVISLVFALIWQRFVLRRDIDGALTTMGQ